MERRIVIVGAGVGGLVAAICLAAKGERVLIIERTSAPGGKLRKIDIGEAQVDAGPTVFTMRWVFDEIFARSGTRLEDFLTLTTADTLARHAWSADERLDLHADLARSADAIGRFSGAVEARNFLAFAAEARRIYQALKQPFLLSQRPTLAGLIRNFGISGLADLFHIKPYQTMWSALDRRFTDPRLRQLFGRYATYCGSSPFHTPATLMLVAHVEQEGVWLIEGGMHRLAQALVTLAQRLGAVIQYNCEVKAITVTGSRVSGIKLANGEELPANSVVVNADANAVAEGLFGAAVSGAVPPVPKNMRSLSAIMWAMVARTHGFPLTRHNVFFSSDYSSEFAQLGKTVPHEPTVYVCAQDRDGNINTAERLLCLINAPALGDEIAYHNSAIENAMRRKLRECGLELDWDLENCVMTTPADFAKLYPATGGALYGRASHGWMASFQRPGAKTRIPGLYLAGGSVHPGPGLPMAALSGRLAAESILSARISA